MTDRLTVCLPRVLVHEGGWADDPQDPGGATMKGITIAVFRAFKGAAVAKDELRAISDADVLAIYRMNYWARLRASELPIGVDYAVFDFAVNSGVDRAARYLQRVIGVVEDGKIGPATLLKANLKFPVTTVELLCAERMKFLRGLRTFARFGRGWTARVSKVEALALEDIADAS